MTNKHKTILSLCDYTGNWCRPYRETGYNVIQVDIKFGQDIRLFEYPDAPIHGILAAPPCTAFAGSGARWWNDKDTDGSLLEGLALVDACLRIVTVAKPTWWCLENPVGRLRRWLGPPKFIFNPCDFGDPYTKRTCLWGEFTPPMPLFVGEDMSVEPTEGSKMHLNYGGKSERTKMLRSITPEGVCTGIF